jgi:hypothetical protein
MLKCSSQGQGTRCWDGCGNPARKPVKFPKPAINKKIRSASFYF